MKSRGISEPVAKKLLLSAFLLVMLLKLLKMIKLNKIITEEISTQFTT